MLNALSGFLLVRWLPKTEYAWFTILNGLAAALMAFVEPVAGVGINAAAAPVCRSPARLGQVLKSASHLQWRLLALGSLFLLPWSVHLLHRNGAPFGVALSLSLIVAVFIAWPMSSAALHGVATRLVGDQRSVFKADLALSASRLAFVALALKAQASALAGLAATGLAQTMQSALVRAQAFRHASPSESSSETDKALLLRQWRHLVPLAIFLGIQAQLGPWMLSIKSDPARVADLGALLRLGIILAVGGSLAQQVLVPRLARCTGRAAFVSDILRMVGGFALSAVCLLTVTHFAPQPFLWLLGSQYSHLGRELMLIMVFFLVAWVSTVAGWINASRGWTRQSWLIIPLTLAMQAVLIWLLPLHELSSVIAFLILSLLPQLAVHLALLRSGVKGLPE